MEKLKLEVSKELYDFISALNGVSVPTRYPDELQRLQKDFNKSKTETLLKKSRKALKWLKARLKK